MHEEPLSPHRQLALRFMAWPLDLDLLTKPSDPPPEISRSKATTRKGAYLCFLVTIKYNRVASTRFGFQSCALATLIFRPVAIQQGFDLPCTLLYEDLYFHPRERQLQVIVALPKVSRARDLRDRQLLD